MSRNSFSFVRGVVVGCAIATLLLVASNLLSLSVETLYGGVGDSLALAEGRSLLLYESQAGGGGVSVALPPAEKVEVKLPLVAADGNGPVNPVNSEEEPVKHHPKNSLLIIVVTSSILLERTSTRISRTWGRETTEYRVVVGDADTRSRDVPNLLRTAHSDFPAFPYLSIGDLNFLLNLVREKFADEYRWFLLVPSNTYVSVHDLEAFLGGVDPGRVVYMGSPSNRSMPRGLRYCEGGPGIVLSHTALRRMGRQLLEGCASEGRDWRDSGYQKLGKCLIRHLGTECSAGLDVPLKQYFLYDRKLKSKSLDLMWKSNSFLTLHPVRDRHHQEMLHTLTLAREVGRGIRRVEDTEDSLQTNPFCQVSPDNCGLLASAGTDAMPPINYTFEDFRHSCNYLHQGYIPEIRRKIVNWESVVGHIIYNSWDLSPQRLVHGDLSKELRFATSAAMQVLKREVPDARLHNVANIYVRYRGTLGREYILDLELDNSTGASGSRGAGNWVERRVALLLPHYNDTLLITPHDATKKDLSLVNFIVPLNGLDRRKVAKFQRTYYTICVRRPENCRLVYVIFSSNKADVKFMQAYLQRFRRRHTKFSYEYVVGTGKYNLTKAYELGMGVLQDDELAFIASVDLSVADHFLIRCRTNTRQGAQVYYPELFMYYNMPYVYRGKWHPRNYDYSRMHGRWAVHAIGCIYKSDYTAVGGYSALASWEVEPDMFQGVVLAKGTLQVMRAPDPGISHWYEATKCNSNLPPNQFSRCLSRRSDNLADRLSLAGYLLSLEAKCGDDKT